MKTAFGRFLLPALGGVLLLGLIIHMLFTFYQQKAHSGQTHSVPESKSVEVMPEIGFFAPEIYLHGLDGKPVELKKLRGKPVVINFWASWCGPCKAEMPEFQKAYQQHRERVHFVMINLTENDNIEQVKEFKEKLGLTFPIYLDEVGDVSDQYRVTSIPSTYAVDPSGKIVYKKLGQMTGAEVEALMKKLLIH